MADLDVLIRDKNGLTELLRVAWRDLANPLLTPFERREARNQIDLYSAELRRQLQRIEFRALRSPEAISAKSRRASLGQTEAASRAAKGEGEMRCKSWWPR